MYVCKVSVLMYLFTYENKIIVDIRYKITIDWVAHSNIAHNITFTLARILHKEQHFYDIRKWSMFVAKLLVD